MLEGFGEKICEMIEIKLKSFKNEGGFLHDSKNYKMYQ